MHSFPFLELVHCSCPILTAASWCAWRFLSQEAGKVAWYSHIYENFTQFFCDPRSQSLWHSWRRLLRVPWTTRRSNQYILKKSVLNSHWKDWCWSWNSNTLAPWCEELTHWKRPWCWERLKEGGEGDDRRGDGWMASPTQWTWIWTNSRSWWWTGRLGVLQFMRLQRVGQDWANELNWYCCMFSLISGHWNSFDLLAHSRWTLYCMNLFGLTVSFHFW